MQKETIRYIGLQVLLLPFAFSGFIGLMTGLNYLLATKNGVNNDIYLIIIGFFISLVYLIFLGSKSRQEAQFDNKLFNNLFCLLVFQLLSWIFIYKSFPQLFEKVIQMAQSN